MNRIASYCFITLLLIMIAGCNPSSSVSKSKVGTEKENLKSQTYYFGEGDEWFGTYTISKVRTSYFESLYIQYITNHTDTIKEQISPKIGKIEYLLKLDDNNSLRSSYPQSLNGIGNFHTATEINEKMFNSPPDEITLEIKWSGKKEIIKLRKQK
ncbi:hypothetical protein [Gottfriedia acidiceleris]|uniref:hypothetical protein n=1 Tax=Gottfriedia acidiceleris TaxID=371036 RepID=UPI00300007EE